MPRAKAETPTETPTETPAAENTPDPRQGAHIMVTARCNRADAKIFTSRGPAMHGSVLSLPVEEANHFLGHGLADRAAEGAEENIIAPIVDVDSPQAKMRAREIALAMREQYQRKRDEGVI